MAKKGNPPAQNREALKHSVKLTLRALVAFVLLGGLLAAVYWWGYNSYRDVAEWVEPGHHEAFIYDGETYYLAGQIGKKGLTKSKYPMDKIIGQIKDDGTPIVTEPETTDAPETEEEFPEDTETWEETETETTWESVIPPAGARLFENNKHGYILYSVEKKEDFLILLEEDGEYYLYYKEGTEDPLAAD